MASSNQKQGIGSFQTDENEETATCLDLFKPAIIENDLVRGKDVIVNPVNFTDFGPYEFNIKSSSNDYIYMPLTKLHGCIQVLKLNAQGEEVACVGVDDYSLINLFSNSLFKQCEIYLNGVQCQDQSVACYGYKAVIMYCKYFLLFSYISHLYFHTYSGN